MVLVGWYPWGVGMPLRVCILVVASRRSRG